MGLLKEKSIKGVLWSGTEKFTVQGLQFIFGIVLARILSPAEYGIVGMLSIFIGLGQVFVSGNLGIALIQKQDRSQEDIDTIFTYSMITAVVIYLGLFFCSDLIAIFYNEPKLVSLTRVISLNLIFYAISTIQSARLSISMDFRQQALASVISAVISGLVGVTLALKGFGVWSLVVKTLTQAGITSLWLWLSIDIKPRLKMYKKSLEKLFKFSSKLLFADLFDSFYRNMYNVLIGKYYGAANIGYYLRAKQFQDLPTVSISEITRRVTFPALSSIQNEERRLTSAYRDIIRLLSFVTVGLSFYLSSIAEPLIVHLLTVKWLPSVQLFQILCFAGIWFPIDQLGMEILVIKGKPDTFLRIDLLKKAIAVLCILASFRYGTVGMVYGIVVAALLSYLINIVMLSKNLHYHIRQQISDLLPFIVIGFGLSILVRVCVTENRLISGNMYPVRIIVGSLLFAVIYIGIARILGLKEYFELLAFVKKIFSKVFK